MLARSPDSPPKNARRDGDKTSSHSPSDHEVVRQPATLSRLGSPAASVLTELSKQGREVVHAAPSVLASSSGLTDSTLRGAVQTAEELAIESLEIQVAIVIEKDGSES